MIKALVVALGVTLSFGVVSAQSKKAPARKTPAARPGNKKADPKASQPDAPTPAASAGAQPPGDAAATPPGDAKPSDAKPGDAKPGDAKPGDAKPSDAKPGDAKPGQPAGTQPAPQPAGGAAGTKPGTPGAKMRTDEKAGTRLERDTSSSRNVSKSDEAVAADLFRQGNEVLNNGLFPQAIEKYRAALSHWDHPAIHYNLALAYINLEQPLEVYAELKKAMEYGADPITHEKFEHAKEYLKLVDGQLADVEVSCDKIGAKVSVDGKEVFIAPGKYTAKVRVGKHTFYAEKQGYNARITAPFIGPNETYRIDLKVYTAEDLTRYRRKWQNTWFPYVFLGAGAAVGLAAGGFELSAQSSYDQFNTKVAACTTMTAGCSLKTPGITSLRDSGDTKRTIGFVGYGMAGAAIGAGAALLWINRSKAYQITAEELETGQPPVAIAPLVSPEAVGAMVQGHF